MFYVIYRGMDGKVFVNWWIWVFVGIFLFCCFVDELIKSGKYFYVSVILVWGIYIIVKLYFGNGIFVYVC